MNPGKPLFVTEKKDGKKSASKNAGNGKEKNKNEQIKCYPFSQPII